MSVNPWLMVRRPVEPEVVEVMAVTALNADAVADWCGGTVVREEGCWPSVSFDVGLSRRTRVAVGSFILKDADDRFRGIPATDLFDEYNFRAAAQ